MAPRRAEAWPAHMLEDPDVRRLDPDGLFVLCGTCEAYHNVHGGRSPRPVRMTSRFRTRAWAVHKRRNMAHTRDRSWLIGVATSHDTGANSRPQSTAAAAEPSPEQENSGRDDGGKLDRSCADESVAAVDGSALDRSSAQFLIIDTEKASAGWRVDDNSNAAPRTINGEPESEPSRSNDRPVVSASDASFVNMEFEQLDGAGCRAGLHLESLAMPVLTLAYAIETLTHAVARQQDLPWPREQLAAVDMLEELTESVRDLQREQQQSFQQLFHLQERTNALMQQLMAPELED